MEEKCAFFFRINHLTLIWTGQPMSAGTETLLLRGKKRRQQIQRGSKIVRPFSLEGSDVDVRPFFIAHFFTRHSPANTHRMNDQQLLEKMNALGARAAIEAILLELERAETKFPAWPSDMIHAAAIVGEESGELIRAALQCYYEGGGVVEAKKEAVQVGAMALRFLKNLAL